MGFKPEEIKAAEDAADIGGRCKMSSKQLEILYDFAISKKWDSLDDETLILSFLKNDYELFLFQLFQGYPGELELLKCYVKWQKTIITQTYKEKYNTNMNRQYQIGGVLILCFLGSLVGGGVLIGKYFM